MQLLTLFTRVPYTLANKQQYEDILSNLEPDKISSSLAQGYSDNLIKGVASVLKNDDDLTYQIKANTTRFAYYKAYKVSSLLNEVQQQYKGKDKEIKDLSYAILNTFNRYQASEYNTTISRCRTAKQWQQFTSDPINNQLFPNIRWIPSRSANPREAHKPFYNKVWAKNDPFWLDNQPGTLWNCKCDWEQTSLPVTNGNPTNNISQPGLRGNPAITGKIFSDDAAYFKVSKTKQRNIDKQANIIMSTIIRSQCKHLYNNKVNVHLFDDGSVDVGFNSNNLSHLIFNDLKNAGKDMYQKNIIMKDIDIFLKKAILVAYEDNKKKDKKTTTIRYYYFQTSMPNGTTIYLNVEKRIIDNMAKYYLYSITKKLRGTVQLIKK